MDTFQEKKEHDTIYTLTPYHYKSAHIQNLFYLLDPTFLVVTYNYCKTYLKNNADIFFEHDGNNVYIELLFLEYSKQHLL